MEIGGDDPGSALLSRGVETWRASVRHPGLGLHGVFFLVIPWLAGIKRRCLLLPGHCPLR